MRLGVNIDHVATLREARRSQEPEPAFAALVCQAAGADSIVAHLREDHRHIKDRDLIILREVLSTKLNMEMSINKEIVEIACRVRPDQATLVPERRQELTTEGGLDVVVNFKRVKEVVSKLSSSGIVVSLFIDPIREQIDAAKKTGVGMIELHTGAYAEAKEKKLQDRHFRQLALAANYGKRKGLIVNAGHGLDYCNVTRIAGIKAIEELNIGYSIICRAVMVGLDKAVREMRELIR